MTNKLILLHFQFFRTTFFRVFNLLLCSCLFNVASAAPVVSVLTVDGAISPGTADYVVRGLRTAAKDVPQLIVLKIDTPGGLDAAMRQIIKQIIASPVPVAVFVAPQGARAASAGTYILYAGHIAAMAPATNLGAATPIEIGIGGLPQRQPDNGPDQQQKPDDSKMPKNNADQGGARQDHAAPHDAMGRKRINDAAAYIRGLAQMSGRNAEWAEQAVREAVSLTAQEALQQHVIDIIAADVPDLLKQLDGRKIVVQGAERTLHTSGLDAVALQPDWRSKLLAVVADPNIAYLLMLAGMLGIFFEFSNPGFVLPGVAGAISLLLALYAFQVLPVNFAGIALIAIGMAFMIAEAFVPSFGILGIGGFVAFIIGSVLFVDTGTANYALSWAVIVPVALFCALFIFLVAGMALKAHRRPVVSGSEDMIGALGIVHEDCDGSSGSAQVHGETWRIRSKQPLKHGQQVRVVRLDGLTLEVEPIVDNS